MRYPVRSRRGSRLVTSGCRIGWTGAILTAALAVWAMASVAAGPQETERHPRRHLRAVEPQLLVLTGGVLIDGTGAPPLPDAAVVVRGDRIIEVGRAGDVEVPPSATVIDVRGATILPGVFNAHVHSSYRQSSLEAWAHAGVTTVRDL